MESGRAANPLVAIGARAGAGSLAAPARRVAQCAIVITIAVDQPPISAGPG